MGLIGIREKIDGNELDLSLMNLKQVPLDELSKCQIIRNLDLSNNKLVIIPFEFPMVLCQITQLDLSKNEIRTLPENFGEIRNLLHLDLYSNKLETLPISFAFLKKLRWLDLKDNPLIPNLVKICGSCSNETECRTSAKRVVTYMGDIVKQVEAKHQSMIIENKENVAEETDDESGKDNVKFTEEDNEDLFQRPKPKAKKGGKRDKGGGKREEVKQVQAIKLTSSNFSECKMRNDDQLSRNQKTSTCVSLSRQILWFFLFITMFIFMDAVYFESSKTTSALDFLTEFAAKQGVPLQLDFLYDIEGRIKDMAQSIFM